MFTGFSSKLLRYFLIAASLFLGLKVDFDLNLFQSNSFPSFRKCHFKRNIQPQASSSILSFALLIWLLVETNFSLVDNNEISTLAGFCLEKLRTFLATLPSYRLTNLKTYFKVYNNVFTCKYTQIL